MRLRLSVSQKIGPVRLRESLPLGKGRPWGSASIRTPLGRLSLSGALTGKRRRRHG